MSTEYLNDILASKDFHTLCCAIILILSIIALNLICSIVKNACEHDYLARDDCGIGNGWFWFVVVFVIIAILSALGLCLGLWAGYVKYFKIR